MPDKRRFVPRILRLNSKKQKKAAEMPTEMTRSSAPFAGRARVPGTNSRDVTPLSPTALAIIAILVLVLHVASSDLLDRPHAHSPMAAPDSETTCPADAKPAELSLPYD